MSILTNIASWFVTVWEWILAALAYFNKPPLPSPDPNVAPAATAYEIIMSESRSIPPMPGTGGVIHPVDTDDATYIATQVVANNATTNLIVLKLAWIKNESRFDKNALDPNLELDKPGQTQDEKEQHWDIGLAQFTLATLKSDFAEQFAGKTDDEIMATAYDLEWALNAFENYTNDLLTWSKEFLPISLNVGANEYPLQTLCAVEAYNKGRTGVSALAAQINSMTYSTFYTTNFAYAIGVLDDAALYLKSFAS